ncbi:hypothetical protein Maeo_1236 [Methanococcus aeolicus Nankai-3]|uniref:Uncharacterized protein n=1 Tax=Methanococcus aeolicus (strain ATCC BAA-1280 / DSM 17508 / OCM 812 / Nankai-3) TaxID=419665 RepID=A6UWE0_META3|nr:hypothetical protein [Methanococcus aeolicus]ABR56812.1 hypothetical protein Maeo_1236 [Methanococcus aeolicus Nankai-3]
MIGVVEKIIGSTVKTINAKDKMQSYLKESYIYNAFYFNVDFDDNAELTADTLNQIDIGIYAGTKDKSFFLGTLLDLNVLSFLQNGRNIVDIAKKKVKSALTYDYDDDTVNTAIYPYLLPDCQIEITNKLEKQVKATLGYIGLDTTSYVQYVKSKYGGQISEEQLKAQLNASINKRIFTGRGETLTATEQTFTISSANGWYDRIIIYVQEGNINELELQSLQTVVERNDMETLTDIAFLRNDRDPTKSVPKQIAIIENLPASHNLNLTINGDKDTKFRILTERIV